MAFVCIRLVLVLEAPIVQYITQLDIRTAMAMPTTQSHFNTVNFKFGLAAKLTTQRSERLINWTPWHAYSLNQWPAGGIL